MTKIKTFAQIALITLACSSFSPAQERSPNRVRATPQPVAAKSQQPAAPDLERNIAITISGALAHGTPIALTLTGCGREFKSQLALGATEIAGNAIPNTGSIQLLVRPVDDGYIISYTVGVQMAVADAGAKGKSSNISFQEVMMVGKVKCVPGKPVEVFKAEGQVLSLGVEEK